MPQILRRLICIHGEISTRDANLVLSVDSHANGRATALSTELFKQTQSGKRVLEVINFNALVELVSEGQVFVQGPDVHDTRKLELIEPDDERYVGDRGVFAIR
jgi:hypothetical protein